MRAYLLIMYLLHCMQKASDNAAFDSATTYFQAGRELLGPNGWNTDPSVMLKLHSKGANACFISGHLDTMNELIGEVLSQDIPVTDKFEVYVVKIKAAYALVENHVAIDTAFEFRSKLGLPTFKNKPVNSFVIIKEFIKTKRTLGSRKAEDIASLPELTDGRIMMGQRMLELASTSCFSVSEQWLVTILVRHFLLTHYFSFCAGPANIVPIDCIYPGESIT